MGIDQIDRREELSSSQVEAESDTATTTTTFFAVKIEKNPPRSKLDELGVTTLSKARDYDYFYLSAQTLASYCATKGVQCALKRARNTNFTIHALWPRKERHGIGPNVQHKWGIDQIDRREELSSSQVEAESDMATTTTKIFAVRIEKNPPRSKLDELGVITLSKYCKTFLQSKYMNS
ncbi:hypothetical protein Tsubulata_000717 [Turnera subulata]|uniref:Uncharacterized protein n=1 Tax=Turnera subulata TaxID=218843 RepID=A0A9Q0F8I1_9ROSI|nr:hypothetical protein Tsubulata_000717 [Turnera subulata]